jgi:hypothetical protein
VSFVGHSWWRRGLIVLIAWAAGARAGWAESRPAPACYRPPTVLPAGGAVVPANLPAFAFRGAEYSANPLPRPIEWYQIEVRPVGGAALAVTIEAGEGGVYLVRPQQDLPAGELVFSFLDDCPPYVSPGRLVDPPVRNDRTTFQVASASALPTELGSATLRSVTYSSAYSCGPPAFAAVVVDVEPSAEALAFYPALTLDARTSSSPYLREGVAFDGARRAFRIYLEGRCDPVSQDLVRGLNAVEIHAVLLGSTATIAPARLSIDLDCGAATDAGAAVCLDASIPAEAPDSGRWDAGLDASPPGQPAPAGGCGCRSAGGGLAAADLLWAGLLAGAMARAGGRRRRIGRR